MSWKITHIGRSTIQEWVEDLPKPASIKHIIDKIRERELEELGPRFRNPCGGCGAVYEYERCLGCFHEMNSYIGKFDE